MLIVALVAALGFVVAFGVAAWRYEQRAKSEYTTASAILKTVEHVKAHEGRWPISWDDLNFSSDLREYVRFRFDVTSKQIIESPDLIHEVITPAVGTYHIYPHANEDLAQLLQTLREMNAAPAP